MLKRAILWLDVDKLDNVHTKNRQNYHEMTLRYDTLHFTHSFRMNIHGKIFDYFSLPH